MVVMRGTAAWLGRGLGSASVEGRAPAPGVAAALLRADTFAFNDSPDNLSRHAPALSVKPMLAIGRSPRRPYIRYATQGAPKSGLSKSAPSSGLSFS